MIKNLPVPNLTRIRFWTSVGLRFCCIFFKANKAIVLEYIKLSDFSIIGEKKQLLAYKFQNALYFEIEQVHRTLINEIIINGSIDDNYDLVLTVYGFLEKRHYKLSQLNRRHLLKRTFLTQIVALKHNIGTRQIQLHEKSLILRSHPVKFNNKNLKTYHSPFSLNDFI